MLRIITQLSPSFKRESEHGEAPISRAEWCRVPRLVGAVMAERDSAAFPPLRKGEKQTAENHVFAHSPPERSPHILGENSRVIPTASQRFRRLTHAFFSSFF